MLKNYTKVKTDNFGTKHYLNDKGECHRLDGPAIEWSNGSKEWYINGNNHRNIDPSVEFSNGKYWYFIGKHHRIGGVFSSYNKVWCIHNKQYTKQEYFNIVWDI